MTLELREWVMDDEEELWRWIEKDPRIWTDFLGFTAPPDKEAYLIAMRTIAVQALQNQAALVVAEDDKGLVGVLAASPITEEGAVGHVAKNPDRKKVGKALIEAGLAHAKTLGLPRVFGETSGAALTSLMKISGFRPPKRTWTAEL